MSTWGWLAAPGIVLCCTWPLQAAAELSPHRTQVHSTTSAGEFAALAAARRVTCANLPGAAEGPPGWRQSAHHCAWQGRLQMRRWEPASAGPAACVSAAARWWTWAQMRATAPSTPTSTSTSTATADTSTARFWQADWSARVIAEVDGTQSVLTLIERQPDDRWIVTQWRWQPSPRAATRAWQARRWQVITRHLNARLPPQPAVQVAAGIPPLLRAWASTVAPGSAAEISADGWRWQRDGLCLRLVTAGLSQAQLHLPYAREDGRLEQRAAIQLHLARTFPHAIWLTPFRLLPAPAPGSHGAGAKYQALWREDGMVMGQLWMPDRQADSVVRVRIMAPFDVTARRDNAAEIARVAGVIDAALQTLAGAWESAHEP